MQKQTIIKKTVVLLCGLSGAGKTTIANGLREKIAHCVSSEACNIVDADDFRGTFCRDLGYSEADRAANIRRASIYLTGVASHERITIASFCAPTLQDRKLMRSFLELCNVNFVNVLLAPNIDVCIKRDPKGLYKKYVDGQIINMVGCDIPYQYGEHDLIIDTGKKTLPVCVDEIFSFLCSSITKRAMIRNVPRALFIGRYQPFHEGHKWLIEQKLNRGIPVAIGIRDTIISDKDPYTYEARKKQIEKCFPGRDVLIFRCPDIESINYGRNVGYAVVEHEPPPEIAEISGTKKRLERIK